MNDVNVVQKWARTIMNDDINKYFSIFLYFLFRKLYVYTYIYKICIKKYI